MATSRIKPNGRIQEDGYQKPTKAERKWDKFKNSNRYNAYGLADLYNNLNGYNKTDDQYRTEAENALKPTYNAQYQALQQQLEQTLQGYKNQLANLENQYAKQQDTVAGTYATNLSTMLNNLTSRGMGRSSLVGTGSVAIANANQKALDQLYTDYSTQANGINENASLATNQNAGSLRTLTDNYAQQLQSRIDEQRNSDRGTYSELQLQINQLQAQAYKEWLKARKNKNKSKGGGGSGGSSGGSGGSSGGSGGSSGGGSGSGSGSGGNGGQFSGGTRYQY